MKKAVCCALAAAVMAGSASLVPAPAAAQETVLKAASVFAKGTTFSRDFEMFIDWVNENGEGLVQIDYVGGPDAIPPFEIGSAVQNGVIDIANGSGAFYATQLPLAHALKMMTVSTQESRENGGWDFINELHNAQMNSWYLARTGASIPFHLYVNEPVEGPDLSGLRLRTTPIYRAFFEELGADAVQTAPGEVYTALERGVVDGYGWPVQGILDLGWHEHTDFRVDPGFYAVDVNILVNLDTWNDLSDEQRDFLSEAALWIEAQDARNAELNELAREEQGEAGIETIAFTGADAEAWIGAAYEAGWAEVENIDPANAPKLRELIDP